MEIASRGGSVLLTELNSSCSILQPVVWLIAIASAVIALAWIKKKEKQNQNRVLVGCRFAIPWPMLAGDNGNLFSQGSTTKRIGRCLNGTKLELSPKVC